MYYVWRKRVTAEWLTANEPDLGALSRGTHAIIEKPAARRLHVEVFCQRHTAAAALQNRFGGRIHRSSTDWSRPSGRALLIRVGQRLTITNVGEASALRRSPRQDGSPFLIIPAGAAFGTGEHVTTAMSL